MLDVGPGSPTSMVFGYGAKFPAKYQEALYVCDWSYGKLYALPLTPSGGTYRAEKEEFVQAQTQSLQDERARKLAKDGEMIELATVTCTRGGQTVFPAGMCLF